MSTHDFGPKFLRRLCGLTAAALLLHAVILGGANWAWPQTAPPPLPAAALQVRVMEPSLLPVPIQVPMEHAAEIAPPPTTPLVTRVKPPPMAAATVLPVVVRPVGEPFAENAAENAAENVAENTAAFSAVLSVQLAAATQVSGVPPSSDVEAIPLYRTRLPPAATLRYDISRGPLHGAGELAWRPQPGAYELKLDFKLGGITVLAQASRGGIDAAGIAPLRFTDQRARRGMTAANFQRSAGKITYSGSQNEFALEPGAQDRLSWMVQLAAIVAAEPQLALPGARVVMQVTGSRGDAGLWVFRCAGAEAIDARSGPVDALKFVREAREAHDTTVQVWLDPKRHHLPVRATQKSGGGDEGFELRLVEVITPI